jgi:hypothetical protein
MNRGRWTRRDWLIGAILVVSVIALAGVAIDIPGFPSSGSDPDSGEATVLHHTYSWVNAYSMNSSLDGIPLPVGSVVEAFDPEGTLVGRIEVNQEGCYGVMALYQDDPETPLDEGVSPGDRLAFSVNGFSADVLGPDEPVWTVTGDLLQLDLVVVTQ